jgi:hypothetical protein
VSDDAVTDDAGSTEPTPEERRALFRVVRGTPTDEELAALTVVLLAAGSPVDAPAPVPSAWADRAATLRQPLPVGPGAWRTSTWPR